MDEGGDYDRKAKAEERPVMAPVSGGGGAKGASDDERGESEGW